ncbi:MAG: hypothetical protein EZS28_049166, partial [Streblomastix strix]
MAQNVPNKLDPIPNPLQGPGPPIPYWPPLGGYYPPYPYPDAYYGYPPYMLPPQQAQNQVNSSAHKHHHHHHHQKSVSQSSSSSKSPSPQRQKLRQQTHFQQSSIYSDEQIRNCDCLFIGNVSFRLDERDISEFFGGFQKGVRSVFVGRKPNSQMSKGFCYVYFQSHEEADIAMKEKQGAVLDGRVVRIDWDVKRGTQPNKIRLEINEEKINKEEQNEQKDEKIANPYQQAPPYYPNYNQPPPQTYNPSYLPPPNNLYNAAYPNQFLNQVPTPYNITPPIGYGRIVSQPSSINVSPPTTIISNQKSLSDKVSNKSSNKSKSLSQS